MLREAPYVRMSTVQEMIIQLGYVNLFAAAFPFMAALALLNNLLEIRVDAYKLLKLTKRPPHQWSGPGREGREQRGGRGGRGRREGRERNAASVRKRRQEGDAGGV